LNVNQVARLLPDHRTIHRGRGAGQDVACTGSAPVAVITKVSKKRGDRMRGLVEYLFGPGKCNEPHRSAGGRRL